MRKALFLLLTLAATFAGTQSSRADELAARRLAATDQLPPALAALQPSVDQIMTVDEAQDVRGEWIVNFNFPLFATKIEGWGRFDISMITLSGGTHAGKPIYVRLTIGR